MMLFLGLVGERGCLEGGVCWRVLGGGCVSRVWREGTGGGGGGVGDFVGEVGRWKRGFLGRIELWGGGGGCCERLGELEFFFLVVLVRSR